MKTVLAILRKVASPLLSPSMDALHVIDSLDWEMTMARYHASWSSSVSLGFALFYNLIYIPSEFLSLSAMEKLYLNLTNASFTREDNIYYGAWQSGVGEEWQDPRLIQNAIKFYNGRIISRIFLIVLMAFCIGAFISSRICIPDSIFQYVFQEYLLKELRSLRQRSSRFGNGLMRRLMRSDLFSSCSTRHKSRAAKEGVTCLCNTKFQRAALMSFVVNVSNPIFFCCVFIPSRILRFLFPKAFAKARPFAEIQHACFQMIVYSDIVRRSAPFPVGCQGCYNIVLYRFCCMRRFLPKYYDDDTLELLQEVDAIFDSFPIDQRIHVYISIMCHSNGCMFILGIVYLLLFLQNALASELVVAYWFSVPHSQKKALPNETNYNLFFNYRELANWEYIINDHFIFLIYFAVNLTCSNATMLLVLAPTFIASAAGFYSNHGTTVDFNSIDPWFLISLCVCYILSFITNALTYRNVCEVFVSRSNDSASVDSNTMLELSHEFMSLSHITLEAMDACCNLSTPPEVPHIKCMMWLLRIQRLQAQRFPFALSDAAHSPPEATPSAVSIRKIFSEEFQPGDPMKSMKFGNFGAYFSSVCQVFNCQVEFMHDYDGSSDLSVCCVESELRHFVCNFLLYVIINSSSLVASDSQPLKVCVSLNVCESHALHDVLTRRSYGTLAHSASTPLRNRVLRHTQSPHRVRPAPMTDAGVQHVQVVAKVLNAQPFAPPSSADGQTGDLPWISSFFELDSFAVLEYSARMQGYLKIPQGADTMSEEILGAFALPCTVAPVTTPVLVEENASLRLLILEDSVRFAESLKEKIKALTSACNYSFHHATNVADALAAFSSNEQLPGMAYLRAKNDSRRTFDVVLIDLFMPMEMGAEVNSQAGVSESFCVGVLGCV